MAPVLGSSTKQAYYNPEANIIMAKNLLIPLLLVFSLAMSGCTSPPEDMKKACTDSGGTVNIQACCKSSEDFPDTCGIGACGCSFAESHQIWVCECGEGRCFDGRKCILQVFSFSDCVKAGYPVMEIYPRQCRTPEGTLFIEDEDVCVSQNGASMSLSEAKAIARSGECAGHLTEGNFCNSFTGTWWIDLSLQKEGCSPACVIDVQAKRAEINWRCTGLIQG
jgi:hypothetical protein